MHVRLAELNDLLTPRSGSDVHVGWQRPCLSRRQQVDTILVAVFTRMIQSSQTLLSMLIMITDIFEIWLIVKKSVYAGKFKSHTQKYDRFIRTRHRQKKHANAKFQNMNA
jgi:hypothetical protein